MSYKLSSAHPQSRSEVLKVYPVFFWIKKKSQNSLCIAHSLCHKTFVVHLKEVYNF